MKILLIRTDKPESEIYIYDQDKALTEYKWEAHRTLAKSLLKIISKQLEEAGLMLSDIEAIGVYEGPGSFTGLRIGITVANTISYSQNIQIVSARGESWIRLCVEKLKNNENQEIVLPFYGQDANITKPRK